MTRKAPKTRTGTHWQIYGPSYLTYIASILIMADLTRHVLQDLGIWTSDSWISSSMYVNDCNSETIACLSVVGFIFTIVLTYTGFTLLFYAALWNVQIVKKVREIAAKWKEYRQTGELQSDWICEGDVCYRKPKQKKDGVTSAIAAHPTNVAAVNHNSKDHEPHVDNHHSPIADDDTGVPYQSDDS